MANSFPAGNCELYFGGGYTIPGESSGFESDIDIMCQTGKAGAGGARQGVTNFFVNTLVTALQASEWCLLLKR